MTGPGEQLEARAEELRSAYKRPLGFPRRLGRLLSVFLLVCGAALVGRLGTDLARWLAILLFASGLVTLWMLRRRRLRLWGDPDESLHRSLSLVDAEEAERAVRAYRLFRRLRQGGDGAAGSTDLAELHASRVLGGFSLEAVDRSAQKVRKRGLMLVLAFGLACFYLLLYRPLNVLEGVDVLLARNGVAPFPLAYVSHIQVTAELPAYLDGTGTRRLVSSRLTTVPQGSEIEVRVVAQVTGRKLLLTDGMREAEFVSDGQGALVARWTAQDPSSLRVAARFGDVLVLDQHETQLAPLDDRGPVVLLEGAPQEIKLDSLDTLPLKFAAADDHGLTQIDLVLRSGQRSSRKELAHLDGQRKTYQGAHTLTREDEILRKAFLPVRVSIEARDGNTSTGPTWGKSEVIVLLPPPLGEEVAQRHVKLRALRTALSSYLAADIAAANRTAKEARELRSGAKEALGASFAEIASQLRQSSQVPARSLAFLEAQLEALSRKGAERATAEQVLLAADVLISDIAAREAQELSQVLGSAVEEIAVQARELRFGQDGVSLDGLYDLLLGASQGAAQLRQVGNLGLDLGSVAQGDLDRVERMLRAGSYDRAEAAAHHLAERLKRATPSFGSKGGAVESGSPRGGGSGSGSPSDAPPSDAPSEFQDAAKAIDKLAQENAQELSELERMLRDAAEAARADFEPSADLRKATEELRRAMQQLPDDAEGSPGSVRAEAASARSQGEAMADALDSGDVKEGVERGVDAAASLKRAFDLLSERPGWFDEQALKDASLAVDEALRRAREQAKQQAQQKAPNNGTSELGERALRQKQLAERARDLHQRGKDPAAPLPQKSLDALEKAADLLKRAGQELSSGRAEEGAEISRQAQRQLEEALPDTEASDASNGEPAADSEGEPGTEGAVPDEDRDRARDFRERVERGLGRESGRLAPAVRRYAEELK